MLKPPGKINNSQPRNQSRELSDIARRLVKLLPYLDMMVFNTCYQRVFKQVPA